MLDEDHWTPVEDQATIGIEYSQERPTSPIGWEIGLMGSFDETTVAGFELRGQTTELYGGVRKTFLDPSAVVRPYLGGGLAFIDGEVEIVGVASGDDNSLAGYVHGGFVAQVSTAFFLGLDLRLLVGSDIEIAGVSGDADYFQAGIVLGWVF